MAAGVTGTSRMVHGQAVDSEYAGYRAFPETEVAEITSNRRVRLSGPNTNEFIQVGWNKGPRLVGKGNGWKL